MHNAAYIHFGKSPDKDAIISWIEQNVKYYTWDTWTTYSAIAGQYPTSRPTYETRVGVKLPEDYAILLKLKFKNVQ